MIAKIVIAAMAVIALGVGGFFLWGTGNALPRLQEGSSDAATLPQGAWIEIVAPRVTERDTSNAIKSELASGDILAEGAVIESEAGAKANIHFPDGSVARLDEKSRIAIAETHFDGDNAVLRVRIRLVAGRVWSKVMSLATPASLWEVRTANTVVAVRGTAFGMAFENGASRVIGSQRAVSVAVVDPETDDIIPGTEVLVEETQSITGRAGATPAIKKNPHRVAAAGGRTPEAVAREPWIRDALREDKKLDEKIDILRRERGSDRGIREVLMKIEQEAFTEAVRAREEGQAPEAKDASIDTLRIEGSEPASIAEPLPLGGTASVPKEPEPASRRIVIEMSGGVRTLAEGTAVQLRAFLLTSDGQKREITKEVSWQVVGPIGAIDRAALFHAQLLPPITEVGEGVGAIAAVWKDPLTGTALTGTTPIFRVELTVQEGPREG